MIILYAGTRLYVYLDTNRWEGQVEGLCGDFNQADLDDLWIRGEEFSEDDFASNWLLEGSCPVAPGLAHVCDVNKLKTFHVQQLSQ